MKKVIGFLTGIVLVAFSMHFIQSCEKSHAAGPVRVLALSSCADTSGTFRPVVSGSLNLSNLNPVGSHFIQVCNEVYVTGKFSWSSVTTAGGPAIITFSLPVPPIVFNQATTYGVFTFTQSGIGAQPFTGPFVANSLGLIQIQFTPTKTTGGALTYSFSYTIQ